MYALASALLGNHSLCHLTWSRVPLQWSNLNKINSDSPNSISNISSTTFKSSNTNSNLISLTTVTNSNSIIPSHISNSQSFALNDFLSAILGRPRLTSLTLAAVPVSGIWKANSTEHNIAISPCLMALSRAVELMSQSPGVGMQFSI